MDVTNNASSEPVILRLYYKPTVLHVSKTVEGYNQEPNKEFTFTLTATPPAGADQEYIADQGRTDLYYKRV